jgi:hypothetical protein
VVITAVLMFRGCIVSNRAACSKRQRKAKCKQAGIRNVLMRTLTGPISRMFANSKTSDGPTGFL